MNGRKMTKRNDTATASTTIVSSGTFT